MIDFSRNPFESITLQYDKNGKLCNDPRAEGEDCKAEDVAQSLEQCLWPDHAVQNTHGSEFSKDLEVKDSDLLVRKGFNSEVSFKLKLLLQ